MPTSLTDLALLRRAINEDWPVPDNVRRAIVGELVDETESSDGRRKLSVVLSFLAMHGANVRAESIG